MLMALAVAQSAPPLSATDYYQNESHQGENRTKNVSRSILETYPVENTATSSEFSLDLMIFRLTC